jgi:hypothetical protein
LTPVPETTGEERGRPVVEVTPVPSSQQSEKGTITTTTTKTSAVGSGPKSSDQADCKK